MRFLFIIFFICLSVILYSNQKIEYMNEQFLISMEIESNVYNGEPIPIKVVYKNISDINIIKKINCNYSGPDIYSENYEPFGFLNMPLFPKEKDVIIKPNECLICEYLEAAYGKEIYKKNGYPSGVYYINLGEKQLIFEIENNIDIASRLQFFKNETYLKGKENVKEIEDLFIYLQKQKLSENIKKAVNYYYLYKNIQFYNIAQKREEFNKIYETYQFDPIKKCYEFLDKYPDSIYYSNQVRCLLFEEKAKLGKKEFIELLKNKKNEFDFHSFDMICLIDKYKKSYNID